MRASIKLIIVIFVSVFACAAVQPPPQTNNTFTWQAISTNTNQVIIFCQTADLTLPLNRWQVVAAVPYTGEIWITNAPGLGAFGFYMVESSNTLTGVCTTLPCVGMQAASIIYGAPQSVRFQSVSTQHAGQAMAPAIRTTTTPPMPTR